MSFVDSMLATFTENGALSHSSSGDSRVDLFFIMHYITKTISEDCSADLLANIHLFKKSNSNYQLT